jgi:hypothetical protein
MAAVIPGMGPMEIPRAAAAATMRRLYFYLQNSGGAAVTGKDGEQPKICVNGAALTTTGVGVLVEISVGLYYADVTVATVTLLDGVVFGLYDDGDTEPCMSLNTLVVGRMASRAAAPHMNKIASDRGTGLTTVYDQDGSTALVTRKRQAGDENVVQAVPQ